MGTRMQQRRGTTAEWTAANPVLAAGEIGIDTTTGIVKVGNGVTAWNSITPPFLTEQVDASRVATFSDAPSTFPARASISYVASATGSPTGSGTWTLFTAKRDGTTQFQIASLRVTNPQRLFVRNAAGGDTWTAWSEILTAASGVAYDSARLGGNAANLYALKTEVVSPTADIVFTGKVTMGDADDDVTVQRGIVMETHARSTVNTYTNGVLTRVDERIGAGNIKSTILNYTGDVLTSVVVAGGGITETTTMAYTNGVLTGTTRVVT